MRELEEAHDMLCLLFAHAPEVLLNVVPHLEEALQGGSLELRILTTKTLGALFGSSSGATAAFTGNKTIAESYHTTWLVWLGRRADKAVQVRVAWVEAACKVLVYHPELRLSIEGTLHGFAHSRWILNAKIFGLQRQSPRSSQMSKRK